VVPQVEDLKRFGMECDLIARVYALQVQKRCSWDDTVHSVRGIEDRLVADRQARRRARHADVVLKAQRQLKAAAAAEKRGRRRRTTDDDNCYAAKCLADVSAKSSKQCSAKARALARIDATSGYYRNPSSSSSSLSSAVTETFRGRLSSWSERRRLSRRRGNYNNYGGVAPCA